MYRLTPVINEIRPHNGVVYIATVGTPVAVKAGGTVVFAGRDGGCGNVVKVQHGPDYVTAYLHLSRFASGIRPGTRVRQGETIAYTGSTRPATRPHPDYPGKYRGNWVDPLTPESGPDEPLPQARPAAVWSLRGPLPASLA